MSFVPSSAVLVILNNVQAQHTVESLGGYESIKVEIRTVYTIRAIRIDNFAMYTVA